MANAQGSLLYRWGWFAGVQIDNPAWEAYMKEVEKYRGGSCKSEREYTPLVK
jgi:hypothetical protein